MTGVADRFVEWAASCLKDSEEGVSYLLGRGSSEEQWARHSIGFVAGDFDPDPSFDPSHNSLCDDPSRRDAWCDTCRYRRWSSSWEDGGDGKKVQLVGRRVSGSVVYPLTSYSGSVVGFQTRSIREKSFDTFMCSKRPEGFFFGTASAIHGIWSTGHVALVEGPSDQMTVERLTGISTLAITTNTLSSPQSRFMRRFVKRAYLFLDTDKAGRDGTSAIISRHGSDFDVIDVPYKHQAYKAKDPNDLWKRIGDDPMKRHLARAMGLM